jgi:uncharacterized membrane protein
MESKAKIAGHQVHPMLIVFPLGLLATAVVFDVIFLISGYSRWTEIAYYLIGAGLIGGLLAALFGWIDWWSIPSGTRAKRVGLVHGLGNVVVLALFTASWLLRRDAVGEPPTTAVVAALAGGLLAIITGWLGGELVERLGVGVHDGAHLDAPSSLSALPATTSLDRASQPAGVSRWTGIERRTQAVPAYAGVERRRLAAR